MGLYEHFPYTDFHSLNIDWLLKKVKEHDSEILDLEAMTHIVNLADNNIFVITFEQIEGVWTADCTVQTALEMLQNGVIPVARVKSGNTYDWYWRLTYSTNFGRLTFLHMNEYTHNTADTTLTFSVSQILFRNSYDVTDPSHDEIRVNTNSYKVPIYTEPEPEPEQEG